MSAKIKGTVWPFLIPAGLLADPENPRIRRSWGLIRFGYQKDRRVRRAVEWVMRNALRLLKRYYGHGNR